MAQQKIILPISGLHCRSCELLLEDGLSRVKNVKGVKVSHKLGQAEISYDQETPDLKTLSQSVEELGYKIGSNKNKNKLNSSLLILAAILIIFFLINYFGLLNFNLDWLQSELSWPLALLVGLVAGISTCMALVGGLVLALATDYAKRHPQAKARQRFQPHLIFNLGRIIGFFILGAVLGWLGAGFKFSHITNGIISLIIGGVILFLGLKLLGFFSNYDLALPKLISRRLGLKPDGGKYKNWRTMILGALTFFVPCGFTQAMQVYALGSGDFLSGGLIMAAFALGTAPGLLGVGGLAALIKGKRAEIFYKIAAIVIIVFALLNLNNGYNLLKLNPGKSIKKTATILDQNVETTENLQIIRMTENSRGYSPNRFTIKQDIPVRLIIDAKAPYSCASAFIIPSLNISRQLKAGENIIEFTPKQTGNIPFSCSMGMYTGNFRVVSEDETDNQDQSTSLDLELTQNSGGTCGQIKNNNINTNSGGSCH
ncbi:MAG: sulfite exporter TauE/SafE family protein [Patescibacteria group bacterium]